MDEVRVVSAGPGQAGLVAGLVADLLGEIVSRTGQPHFQVDVAALAETAAGLLEEGRLLAFLALRGAESVGVATLSPGCALYAGGATATLTELYVRPGERALGVGSKLLDAVTALAREKGWRRVEVTTPPLPAFDATLAFYQGRGFVVAGGKKLCTIIW